MMAQLTVEQNKLIEEIALNNGFTDYEVITNPGSVKGDNFLGIITLITLKSGERILDLIIKTAHQNEAFRKAAPLEQAYMREIYLYEVIFNEFQKFQDENDIMDQFVCYPKIFATCKLQGHECLVMENLKANKYQLWDKKVPMNPQHLIAVLKEYAKFHAISLAMRQKNPKLFNQLSEKLNDNIFDQSDIVTSPEKLTTYITSVFKGAYKAVEDDAVLIECLQKLEKKLINVFLIEIKNPKYKMVINHGDSWCNNFLFKYEDPNNKQCPSSLRILDWQLSCLTSPASDVCYFFQVHCTREMFADYEHFLKMYYDQLAEQLRNFKCDPDEVFSYSQLKDHCKTFMKTSLCMSLMVLKIMVCESDEAPDLAQESTEQGDISKSMDFKISNFDAYKERVRNVMEFLKNNDFLK